LCIKLLKKTYYLKRTFETFLEIHYYMRDFKLRLPVIQLMMIWYNHPYLCTILLQFPLSFFTFLLREQHQRLYYTQLFVILSIGTDYLIMHSWHSSSSIVVLRVCLDSWYPIEDFLGKIYCSGVVCHCLLQSSFHICVFPIPSPIFHGFANWGQPTRWLFTHDRAFFTSLPYPLTDCILHLELGLPVDSVHGKIHAESL
jgi:hypothetical protein